MPLPINTAECNGIFTDNKTTIGQETLFWNSTMHRSRGYSTMGQPAFRQIKLTF
jgi:hypothetical protein